MMINDVKSDLIIAIDKTFKAHGIVIPFPQRDIHMINKPEGTDSESEIQIKKTRN
ncbi:MAG: hypothetical protein U5K51_14420 [Flavobacteriaceae bacterium]|nr:hypothetical protein [Flavobacteriaceae bacterium]